PPARSPRGGVWGTRQPPPQEWRTSGASLRRMLRGRFGHVVGGVGIALPHRLCGGGGGVLGRLQLHLGVQLGPDQDHAGGEIQGTFSPRQSPQWRSGYPPRRGAGGLSCASDTAPGTCGGGGGGGGG